MTEAPHDVVFVIESRFDQVRRVGAEIEKLCLELGFDQSTSHSVELCAVEAITNVIRHAYGGAPGRSVETRLTVREDCLELRVLDEGVPIPEAKKRPALQPFDPRRPETIPEGGRGVFLIHSLMDAVEYGTLDGRNVITMIKLRPRRSLVRD